MEWVFFVLVIFPVGYGANHILVSFDYYQALNGEDYRTAYSKVTGFSKSGEVNRDGQKQRNKYVINQLTNQLFKIWLMN